ncbi:transmembrane protein, putative (macronuclear) [Tetrahymena thermophila SB210]|uniref:Transmembrane protein, putative n=1 Tax=Tetrahymena thermophila (strain SB210) TaxID=312017 RepID=W7XDI4_TETTS|nr:transmembrane protein, putative [Tetrahymena thermophila SB210]EWS71896.1 transmembrane protein, putative [Tetrahymena thermophila SB210]|eukprot:XP_012655574.1 transmembrane protein, putative [Tetrahymena thermophila SB210]
MQQLRQIIIIIVSFYFNYCQQQKQTNCLLLIYKGFQLEQIKLLIINLIQTFKNISILASQLQYKQVYLFFSLFFLVLFTLFLVKKFFFFFKYLLVISVLIKIDNFVSKCLSIQIAEQDNSESVNFFIVFLFRVYFYLFAMKNCLFYCCFFNSSEQFLRQLKVNFYFFLCKVDNKYKIKQRLTKQQLNDSLCSSYFLYRSAITLQGQVQNINYIKKTYQKA